MVLSAPAGPELVRALSRPMTGGRGRRTHDVSPAPRRYGGPPRVAGGHPPEPTIQLQLTSSGSNSERTSAAVPWAALHRTQ